MVKVRFYGQARKVVGAEELSLEDAAGVRLEELLARFGGVTGGASAGLVNNVLINGRNCMFVGGLDTTLADGDVVDVLPVVGGG